MREREGEEGRGDGGEERESERASERERESVKVDEKKPKKKPKKKTEKKNHRADFKHLSLFASAHFCLFALFVCEQEQTASLLIQSRTETER